MHTNLTDKSAENQFLVVKAGKPDGGSLHRSGSAGVPLWKMPPDRRDC